MERSIRRGSEANRRKKRKMSTEKRSEAIVAAEVEWVSLLSLNLHAWKLDGTPWDHKPGSLLDRNRDRFKSIAQLIVAEKVL